MTEEIIDGVDVSECRYYRKDKNCDIWGISCQMKEFCYFKILKQENARLKEKLEKIKELATPLRCNNPLDCWMNQDVGAGDIYGCDGDDYKGCPYGFASYILKIIEGADDANI